LLNETPDQKGTTTLAVVISVSKRSEESRRPENRVKETKYGSLEEKNKQEELETQKDG